MHPYHLSAAGVEEHYRHSGGSELPGHSHRVWCGGRLCRSAQDDGTGVVAGADSEGGCDRSVQTALPAATREELSVSAQL